MLNGEIIAKVDNLSKWMKLAEEARKEIERIKGEFQKLGVEALNDKKVKQVEFWGSDNAKVVITCSESLKVVSHSFLSQTLGYILSDFVKEERIYKYTEPFKRILTAVFQGTYVEQSVDDVIAQVATDDKTATALKKKLKGNWEKDVETLKNLAGLRQMDAEHYAYFVQEAANYERIVQLLETAGYRKNTIEFEVALRAIRNAVVVEEGIKVGVEYDESGDMLPF